MSSSIESTIGSITSSHIPVYQPLSHSIKQTNTKISNGFNAEPQPPSNSNPFQHTLINNNGPIHTSDSQHKSTPIATESIASSTIPITSPPLPSYLPQYSPSVSQTSSTMSERITDSPLPMMPNFMRSPLQTSLRNVDSFSPLVKVNPVLAAKSPPPMEPTISIPRNDEFATRIGNLNYNYQQTETPIATLEHQRIDHLRQPVSPQLLQFQEIQEIETRMVDQLNELYKATMLIHSNQRETPPPRREHEEVELINKPYLQHEPTYSNSGTF